MNALGMIETNSIPLGIDAADAMLKAASVELVAAQPVCAGKYIVIITGEVAAVKSSVEAGKIKAGQRLVDSMVIPHVHEQVPNPPFLESVIELFRNNHNLTIEEICACFAKFNEHYQCNKMEPGTDFDYVLYFPDHNPDSWYYCIKMEMEHTIYHRFTEADYYSFVS